MPSWQRRYTGRHWPAPQGAARQRNLLEWTVGKWDTGVASHRGRSGNNPTKLLLLFPGENHLALPLRLDDHLRLRHLPLHFLLNRHCHPLLLLALCVNGAELIDHGRSTSCCQNLKVGVCPELLMGLHHRKRRCHRRLIGSSCRQMHCVGGVLGNAVATKNLRPQRQPSPGTAGAEGASSNSACLQMMFHPSRLLESFRIPINLG